jgi:hypothetical protein
MRNKKYLLYAVILIASCSRKNIDIPQNQAAPLLKRIVQTDTSGAIMRVSYFNDFEMIARDTVFKPGTNEPGAINIFTYNAKAKLTRWEYFIPILYTGGYYWAWDYYYQHDTIPTETYRYLKGNQVAHITNFYNGLQQLIMDSTYHTPNYGTFTYLKKYGYDMAGRIISSLELNDTRDTVAYITYKYAPNIVEQSEIDFSYNPLYKSYLQTISEYTASGKILSEKKYGGQVPVLSSQTDYIYDSAGNLLKKNTTQGSFLQEEWFFYNSITGKPEKKEFYVNNRLSFISTYFYD